MNSFPLCFLCFLLFEQPDSKIHSIQHQKNQNEKEKQAAYELAAPEVCSPAKGVSAHGEFSPYCSAKTGSLGS